MNTALFWDDQRIFCRKGLKRIYGEPEFLPDSVYYDPQNSASGGMPSIVQNPKGDYTLFYQAFTPEHKTYAFAATSPDGIHWNPRNIAKEHLTDPDFPNQLLPTDNAELACVYEDLHGPAQERYKAFVARYHPESLTVEDLTYVSPDGLDWNLSPVSWSDRGAEPGAGCVYSEILQRHMILCRSGWGIRRLCIRETPDWKTFLPSREAVQVDSLDPPQTETYGMPVFQYKGWYIGLLWLYHTLEENQTHYMGGTMDCQLCYSVNGAHWQRSLRTPFIGNHQPQTKGMVFPSAVHTDPDGNIYITASATPHQHGYFKEPGGCIVTYRLREDGFICLEAQEDGAALCTRELLLHSGAISWNLQGQGITVAVYEGTGGPLPQDYRPLEGFAHEDCIPFSGDTTRWVPSYKSGRGIESLAGKPVFLEIRLSKGGRIYAYQGDFTPLMNTETMRYLKFGKL